MRHKIENSQDAADLVQSLVGSGTYTICSTTSILRNTFFCEARMTLNSGLQELV
jgi:hypothetical protein